MKHPVSSDFCATLYTGKEYVTSKHLSSLSDLSRQEKTRIQMSQNARVTVEKKRR
jgi:hypothetical protein